MPAKLLVLIVVLQAVLTGNTYALEINTDGHRGVSRALSAKTNQKGTLNVGSGFSFAQSYDYFRGPVENGNYSSIQGPNGIIINETTIETARVFSSNIFLNINPFSFLNFAISLPYYYDWSGITGVNDGGLGDLRLSTKVEIPSAVKAFHQGYFLAGTIPVGFKKNGLFPRHSYIIEDNIGSTSNDFYSTNSATLTAALLLTFDFYAFNPKTPIQIHANLGGSATSSTNNQRNLILASFAVEYTPLYFLTLFLDLSGESRISNFSTDVHPTEDPLLLTPGLKINTPSGIYLDLAADISLSSKDISSHVNQDPLSGVAQGYKYSTGVIPSYGAQFILGWNGFMTIQDDDKDGIKNNVDRCPKEPEDIDGYEDNDGCPDPDNDKDGIIDSKDKCRNVAEDIDGFNDEDGCPDLDNDSDGITDIEDHCPLDAEDKDGFEDLDGCPDLDNDKDGITDSLDKCKNEPEDFDRFQDEDGCPDPDNDADGIPDSIDQCPDIPETTNNYLDNDGCPDTLKKEITIPAQQILKNIQFRNNGPELTINSYQYIEPLCRQLKQFLEVEIEVRAYTDALGESQKNYHLTQMRAEAVRQYLISKGIDSNRIRAVGFGSSNPVAENRTAAGRAQNRRIEIIRLK